MIKLISKRRLAFRNPADGTFVTVLPQVFESVPDWAAKDPIFRWGVEDGTIQTVDQTLVSGYTNPVKDPSPAEAAGEKNEDLPRNAKKVKK